MKRALSTGQPAAPTDLPSESNSLEEFFQDFLDEQTQSEPELSNRTSPDYSMLMDAEFNELSIPAGEHTAPEKSDRSSSASSEAESATTYHEITALKKAASSGDVESQFRLGDYYYCRQDLEENKEQAFMWYHNAASQGHIAAQFNVGLMYTNGEGVDVDKEKAFTWYHAAADQGHMFSQIIVGATYETEVGVEKNKEKAFGYFHKAAEQGDSIAQFKVGLMYAHGTGVEINKGEAFAWYQKAANQGHAFSLFAVGIFYKNGLGVEVNKEEAFAYFLNAAEQGFLDAKLELGLAYLMGEGVEKSSKKAFALFQEAALQGQSEAQFNLGLAYAEGKGVKANREKAFEWFCKAAEQGHHKAQRRVSECYQTGIGVEKDLPMATYWLLKSLLSTTDTQKIISLDHHRELIKLFPSILEKYSEFKDMNRINFYSGKDFFGDEEVATIAEFIRSNSNVTDLEITHPLSASNIDLSALVEALKVNTQLTDLKFSSMLLLWEINGQIAALLVQNKDIAELRQYVVDLHIEKTPGFPLDIVKIMVDKTIVANIKGGQTKEATQKAIDELLIIAGIKTLEEDTKIN